MLLSRGVVPTTEDLPVLEETTEPLSCNSVGWLA